jgi:hypothetical protein
MAKKYQHCNMSDSKDDRQVHNTMEPSTNNRNKGFKRMTGKSGLERNKQATTGARREIGIDELK